MNPLRILFLSALILVVFGSTEVNAEKEPEWNYTRGDTLGSHIVMPKVAISEDGEYIAVGGRPGDGTGRCR